MSLPDRGPALPRSLARVAVVGMSLAVVALGGLAVWSASATQREADGLNRAGVQISGQLRAVQALFVVRVETDELEDDLSQERLDRLRAALRVLPEALERMENGNSPEATRVARQAQPLAAELAPAVEKFVADPLGDIRYHGEEGGDDTSEDAMEDIITELEALLYASESDPANLLDGKLENATEAGQAVRRTALIMLPLGMGGVLACGWLLSAYRRRSESVMRTALEMTAREARTDQLTGLPNRRALLEELDRRVAAGESFTVAMADLNGFKHYNDTFGHPAGDDLLRRLGRKLATAWEGHGFAARLGGDEFCVLADNLSADQLQKVLHTALSEDGEGFVIGAVSGVAAVPTEAADGAAALGLADTRLYLAKAAIRAPGGPDGGRPGTPAHASTAGSLGGLSPFAAGEHFGDQPDRAARLAVGLANALGLPAEEIPVVELAAQLHDVGKVAIPAAILAKRGALTEEEQQFVRRHSVIGERLVSRVDILDPVAAVVRATHERWDGNGWPDQLAGDAIPIGARIIAVVDAYCAMTSDRPHAPARSAAEALAELRRCAGTQFDPAVVAAATDGRLEELDSAYSAG